MQGLIDKDTGFGRLFLIFFSSLLELEEDCWCEDVGGATLTWSCLTCSWSVCWAFAAICEASRNLVEHLCFRPSISSVQYRCRSPNSWQVSASLSSKLTCGICQHSLVRTDVLLMRRWLKNGENFSPPVAPVVQSLAPAAFAPGAQSATHP